jgi:hypothetical protein
MLQRQLRNIEAVNDARKETLSFIARDRLAYYEYLDLLEDLNKQIATGYTKIIRANQKAAAATLGRRKNKPGSSMGGDGAAGSAAEKDKDALAESLRLKTLVLDVPDNLMRLVRLRAQFKEVSASSPAWGTSLPLIFAPVLTMNRLLEKQCRIGRRENLDDSLAILFPASTLISKSLLMTQTSPGTVLSLNLPYPDVVYCVITGLPFNLTAL